MTLPEKLNTRVFIVITPFWKSGMMTKLLGDDITEKQLKKFSVIDPFNGNQLDGYLCFRSDHRYGALHITHVNNKKCPQVVYGVPKLHYPFGKDHVFNFPKIVEAELYEKIDGTSVTAYQYADAKGEVYTTFKLRLCPVLVNSRYGGFLDMWESIVDKNPSIMEVCNNNEGKSICFELFGSKNEHLIRYSEKVAYKLLMGVTKDGFPLPPSELNTKGLACAEKVECLKDTSEDMLELHYDIWRDKIENSNKVLEDGKIQGSEGTVWYCLDKEGIWRLYKCKPHSVECIHWSAGGIPKEHLRATCWNLLEIEDDLTFNKLLPLLQEEYTQEQIDISRERISVVINEVQVAAYFKTKVLNLYKELSLDINKDKRKCMRALSEHFRKDQMKQVYTTLINNV